MGHRSSLTCCDSYLPNTCVCCITVRFFFILGKLSSVVGLFDDQLTLGFLQCEAICVLQKVDGQVVGHGVLGRPAENGAG